MCIISVDVCVFVCARACVFVCVCMWVRAYVSVVLCLLALMHWFIIMDM